jgi:hypothetical protein
MAAPRSESADDLSFLWRPGTRGLTRTGRPLYSGGFAPARVWLSAISPCGGIGRRARLKIEFRKECWFDSGQGHQSIYGQSLPPAPITISNSNTILKADSQIPAS